MSVNDLVEMISLTLYPFQINDNTYQKLKISGSSSLVKMPDLSNLIHQYYSRDQKHLNKISDWDMEASKTVTITLSTKECNTRVTIHLEVGSIKKSKNYCKTWMYF